jgi:hypothetical protein
MRLTVRLLFSLALVFLVSPWSSAAVSAPIPQARMGEKHREFFKSYCLECHNERKQKGQVRLDDLSFQIDTTERADRWQKVLNQINSGEMPPEEAKQPERARKTEFLGELSETMMLARKVIGDQGRKQVVRRLNKREYRNTIRDLLGVDLDVSELPSDGGTGSFDTVGSALSMSSDQFETYLALGRRAVEEAMAVQKTRLAKPLKDHRELEVSVNAQQAKQIQAHTDNAQKYTDWTRAIDEIAGRPEHAATVTELRKRLAGRGDATPMFYMEWVRLKWLH